MSKYIHFSDNAIDEVRSVQQTERPNGYPLGKPVGFWLSVEGNGDGWSDWCKAEGFRDIDGQYEYEVELAKNANILFLRTEKQVRDFSEKYLLTDSELNRYSNFDIDWATVAKIYQGIVISPYIWGCRYDLMWYNGWDCASGCIWDAKAIEKIELVKRPAVKKSRAESYLKKHPNATAEQVRKAWKGRIKQAEKTLEKVRQ